MTRRPARAAFTLVELLVVISIIAVLLALLLPGIQKIRDSAARTTAASDIRQLEEACTQFKSKYGFYPPCQFTFPTSGTHASCEVFKTMFPRWTPAAVTQPSGMPATISGSQCLVYFLGGPSLTGWAIDQPVAPSSGAASKNTFFDFQQARVTSTGNYLDTWGTPYAYIASGPGNNYGAATAYAGYPSAITVTPPGTAVAAYTSGGRPVNAGGVQIISAGKDKAFGPGGAWNPGTSQYLFGIPGGGDDVANFNGGAVLGTAGN